MKQFLFEKYRKMLACHMAILALASTLTLSCKKFVEIGLPKGQLLTPAVFHDSTGATSAVLGIYIDIMQNFSLTALNGGITIYTGLSSDEISTTLGTQSVQEFNANSITPKNSVNQNLWSLSYKTLYNINASIEALKETTALTDHLKRSLTAECKFLRGFVYFNLVNLYGPIPLVTSPDYHINKALPRSPIDTVYELIIRDLLEAKSGLAQYPVAGRIRPNVHAASALLAKVYLFKNDWLNAESESSSVINSGIYSLEPLLNSVFTTKSSETIWQLQVVLSTRATLEGFNFIPGGTATAKPNYPLTAYLLSAFEAADQRKAENNWIKSKTINAQTFVYPYKYKTTIPSATNPEHYVVIRLAEQYLIRAEAKARQGKIVDALSDLNRIRNRAKLANITASNQNSLLDAIFRERRLELFCEWGNRWFDLKRTTTADLVLSSLKSDWNHEDALYPVPQAELDKNPFLQQNPGY